MRIEYKQRSLAENDVHENPIIQFTTWLNEAIAAGCMNLMR